MKTTRERLEPHQLDELHEGEPVIVRRVDRDDFTHEHIGFIVRVSNASVVIARDRVSEWHATSDRCVIRRKSILCAWRM